MRNSYRRVWRITLAELCKADPAGSRLKALLDERDHPAHSDQPHGSASHTQYVRCNRARREDHDDRDNPAPHVQWRLPMLAVADIELVDPHRYPTRMKCLRKILAIGSAAFLSVGWSVAVVRLAWRVTGNRER
jgi:hypothetical protein